MDIGLIIKRTVADQRTEYYTGDSWGSKPQAMLYVSEACFIDAHNIQGAEVCIRLLGGKEIPVSRSEMFYPSHRSLQ